MVGLTAHLFARLECTYFVCRSNAKFSFTCEAYSEYKYSTSKNSIYLFWDVIPARQINYLLAFKMQFMHMCI